MGFGMGMGMPVEMEAGSGSGTGMRMPMPMNGAFFCGAVGALKCRTNVLNCMNWRYLLFLPQCCFFHSIGFYIHIYFFCFGQLSAGENLTGQQTHTRLGNKLKLPYIKIV